MRNEGRRRAVFFLSLLCGDEKRGKKSEKRETEERFFSLSLLTSLPSLLPLCLLFTLVLAAGCFFEQPSLPPSATVTEIEPTTRPAKSPDCHMPVLYADPTVDYKKVAIVDGWGSLKFSEEQVLEVVKRKACETGADALLILTGTQQNTRKLLYEGAPNPARNSQTANQVPGDYLIDREKVPEIGSVGHPGTYVDAVAIIYTEPNARK